MAEKKEVYKQKLKQKGYWNYVDLYNFCFDWLKDEGYNVKEKEYVEKLSSFGKEIMLKWVASKKVTDYFKNEIEVNWHILGMKDAEVEQDGKKVSTNKGEVGIVIKATLVRDYEERWEDKPIWKFLRGIYEKYVIRTTVDEYEDSLEDKAKEYLKDMKAFLQIGGR
ncbi:hypothetical protein KAJ38_01280 [Candidatus Pacearchaeota archaeon]|nr:hypothetical protein [Candidatus Pacearchaeota archaeon]